MADFNYTPDEKCIDSFLILKWCSKICHFHRRIILALAFLTRFWRHHGGLGYVKRWHDASINMFQLQNLPCFSRENQFISSRINLPCRVAYSPLHNVVTIYWYLDCSPQPRNLWVLTNKNGCDASHIYLWLLQAVWPSPQHSTH